MWSLFCLAWDKGGVLANLMQRWSLPLEPNAHLPPLTDRTARNINTGRWDFWIWKWGGKWNMIKGMSLPHSLRFRQIKQIREVAELSRGRKKKFVPAVARVFPCSLCKCCYCLDSTCWSSDCSRHPLYATIRAASLKYFALFEVVWNFRLNLGIILVEAVLPDFVMFWI